MCLRYLQWRGYCGIVLYNGYPHLVTTTFSTGWFWGGPLHFGGPILKECLSKMLFCCSMLPQWAALPDFFQTPGSSNFKHYVVNFKTYRASHCNGAGSGNCWEHQTAGGEGSCIENTPRRVCTACTTLGLRWWTCRILKNFNGSAIGKGASRRWQETKNHERLTFW